MTLGIILLTGGVIIILGLYFWSRRREDRGLALPFEQQIAQNVPLASSDDAVLVSQGRGQIVYANARARHWVGMNGGQPDLEFIAQMAQPMDNFLELFAGEGQSSFQLGSRWVEASSHTIPTEPDHRTVVIMREISANTSHPEALDLSKAMATINEIGETINVTMSTQQVFQALLAIVMKAIPANAGEICLWNPTHKTLNAEGWVGTSDYLLAHAELGGQYRLGEGITGWIAQHRRPVLVANVADYTALQPKLAGFYESFIGVPLLLGNRFIGTLELAVAEREHFGQTDLTLLQAVSKQVAIAIYNAELYAEQTRRINDMASLQEITRHQETITETRSIYRALNERIARLIDVDQCGVYLYDENRQALAPELPFYGLPDPVIRDAVIPMPPDSPQRDIWERQAYWIANDAEDEPLIEALGLSGLFSAAGIRNIALIPLQIGNRRIGLMQLSNKHTEGGFTAADISEMRILAAQAGVVVENIRLFLREQRRDEELFGLQEITRAIGALNQEGDFYANVTQQVAKLMGVAMCGIMLYDEERQQLVSQLPFYGAPDDLIAHYRIALPSGSPLRGIWEEDDWWYTNRVQTNAVVHEARLAEFAGTMGVRQTLMAVMAVAGRRLGIVQVSNKTNSEDFTDKDARLLLIFATQTAAMIENSRLYQEMQRGADEATRLRNVAELAGKILTIEDSFAPVMAEIAQLVQSPLVYINVLDQQTGSLITYPRWVYGIELSDPIVQDIYSKGFENSVAVSHQAFVSNDVLHDKRVLDTYHNVAQKTGIQSTVLVPLIVGDRSMGELGVANRRNPAYDDEDRRLVEAIAAQIAATIERLRLYEAAGQNLSRRVQELDAIARVSHELTQTLELDIVLEVIRHEATRATRAESGTIVLLRPPAVWQDANVPEMDRRLGDKNLMPGMAAIEAAAIERGSDTVLISDYNIRKEMQALPHIARSAIAAAFLYEDQVVGVVHLFHVRPNAFDERAAAFVLTMAAKASLAYGNYQRYRALIDRSARLRQRVEQLNQIFELGRKLHTSGDHVTMLEEILGGIHDSVGFQTTMVALVDEDAGLLRRVAQVGMPLDLFEQSKDEVMAVKQLQAVFQDEYQISESYFLPVEKSDQWSNIGLNTLSTHKPGKRINPAQGQNGKSWTEGDMLLVPLYGSGNNLLGVISLDYPQDNLRPDRNTIEILEIFSHQAAATIENMRLYLATVQNAEQEARLNEIMEAIASTLNTEDIVTALAHGALRMVPYNQMTVALLNPEQQGFNILKVSVAPDSKMVIAHDHNTHLEHTALGHTFESGQEGIYHAHLPETETYEDLRTWHQQGERTSLIVPLFAGGVCLGALHLGSDLEQAAGFNEYLPLLKRMANLAAVAMQNARLFNQAINLQNFNESVVESIQQGIVVLDKSGLIQAVNDFMTRRYGWVEKAALKQDLFAYRPILKTILKNDVRDALETGQPRERIGQHITLEDGQEVVTNFYSYPLRSGDSVRGAVLLVEDVTARALLEKDVRARADQLAALTEVSSRITATLKRDDVVDLALNEFKRILPYDTLTLWSRDGETLELEGADGFNPRKLATNGHLPRVRFHDHERLGKVIETKRPFSINHFQGWDALPGENQAKSWLGVPLVNQGVVAGLIAITRQQPGSFDEQAEQAAFAFANQMAIALSNAHLYAQAEYRNERLSLLNRVSISLAQSLDSENILEIGLREIALAMNVGHARAFVFERDLQIARTIVVYPRGDTPPDEIISLVDSPIFHEIRQTVAPIIYEDTSRLDPDSPVALELAPRQARAYAMIPMTVGGQVIGAYELEIYDAPRYFNPEQIELAIIIANQSAIAVQNTNLLEQTLVRTRELETMLEAAQATSLTLSLEETFRNVVELILHALEMNDCALMIWDNVENVLEVQLDLNRFDDPERVLPVGSKYDLKHYPAKRRAVEEREIIVIRADDNEADPTEVNELRRSADTFRVLIPLVMRDQAIGLIQTDVQAPHRIFAHREIRLAQALSAQAAIAIQNARLSTETAALVEEGFIINNLSQAIASKLEIEDMIAIVRDQVARVTDAEEIYLALYDAQTETISFPMAVRQGEDLNIPNRQLNTDEVSFIVKHKRSLTLGGGNWSSDDMRRNLGIANGEGDTKSYLGVPVKSGDQVIGVLALIDRRNTRAFGINDERLLTTVGTQLGAGIQNARLFNQVSTFAEDLSRLVQERTQDLQQERDRIDTLYRITSELARTLDMERIVRRGLEMIVGAVNADDGVIMLIDPLSDDLFTRATYLTDAPAQVHPAHDLAAWLMENDRSIVVNDLHHTDFWDAQASGADGYRSAMAVLLESGDDPQGVLVVLGKELGAFSETQLKLVSAAATQVASAINNADLYHLIRDQAERLGLLLRTEQEEAEKNQAIVEGIADGVMLADAEGIIILFNSAAERVLALPRDNVIGQQLFKLTGLFGGLGTEWAQAIQEWELNPQEHPAGEFLEARLDLGKRVVNVHLSPVHIGERFLGTVSVFRDITKEVEVDRTKSQFVSNVSHELRTPMTSIKGFAELLLMGVAGQLSDQQRGLMQKIKSNADRMSQLVNDLLNISKIDAGERLNLELIEVGPIVENVIGTVQSKSHNERKEMKVTVDIAPLLPPIKADEQKITQVVSNIIENAFNYTPPGGSIDVRVRQDNDRVVIAVKDSGIGIPDEFRSRIWQRFERYDEHALVMDVPGTGLGLSIAKEFIEMHRGDIWFDSELNKGTTFYISLPVDQPDEFAQGSD